MHIEGPFCDFKNCRYYFDGNCTKKNEYERCLYQELKNNCCCKNCIKEKK